MWIATRVKREDVTEEPSQASFHFLASPGISLQHVTPLEKLLHHLQMSLHLPARLWMSFPLLTQHRASILPLALWTELLPPSGSTLGFIPPSIVLCLYLLSSVI